MKKSHILLTLLICGNLIGCQPKKETKPTYQFQVKAEEIDMKVGTMYTVPVSGEEASQIKWLSSDESVVKVNKKGQLEAKGEGQSIVSAKIGSEFKDIVVNVSNKNKKDIKILYQNVFNYANSEKERKKDISIYKVTLEKENYIYTGQNIEPVVKVNTLIKDKDYQVTYSDNKEVGLAHIQIKGIGHYEGQLETSFKIIKEVSRRKTTKLETTRTVRNEQRTVKRRTSTTRKTRTKTPVRKVRRTQENNNPTETPKVEQPTESENTNQTNNQE